MAKRLLFVGLLAMMVWGAGCVVIDVEKLHSCEPASVESQEAGSCDAAVVCVDVHSETLPR